MAIVQTNLEDLHSLVTENPKSFGYKEQPKQWSYSPMFMPVSTEGKPVVQVTTRLEFLKRQIKDWRNMKISYFLAFGLGAAALWLLSVNPLFAVAAGAAAGWFYGGYVMTEFFLVKIGKKRPLLEGT